MVSKEFLRKARRRYELMKSNYKVDILYPEYKCANRTQGELYCNNHNTLCGEVNICQQAHKRRDFRIMPGDSSNGEVKDWEDFR